MGCPSTERSPEILFYSLRAAWIETFGMCRCFLDEAGLSQKLTNVGIANRLTAAPGFLVWGCQREPWGAVLFWLRGAHCLSLTITQSVTVWSGLVSVDCRLPSRCPCPFYILPVSHSLPWAVSVRAVWRSSPEGVSGARALSAFDKHGCANAEPWPWQQLLVLLISNVRRRRCCSWSLCVTHLDVKSACGQCVKVNMSLPLFCAGHMFPFLLFKGNQVFCLTSKTDSTPNNGTLNTTLTNKIWIWGTFTFYC